MYMNMHMCISQLILGGLFGESRLISAWKHMQRKNNSDSEKLEYYNIF